MKVVKHWQDSQDEDGFKNIFEFEDGSLVFTTEKRAVWRDCSGDILDVSVYKGGFKEFPEVDQAIDDITVDSIDFDEDLQEIYQRCIGESI